MNGTTKRIAIALVTVATVACSAPSTRQTEVARIAKPTCPAALSATGSPIPDGPATAQFPDAPTATMVPGTPAGATVCRYSNDPDPRPKALVRSAWANATQAAQLAESFNSATVWPAGVYYPCPFNQGGVDLVIFAYSSRGPDDVLVDLSGCQGLTNGHRTAAGAEAAHDLLNALVGVPPVRVAMIG